MEATPLSIAEMLEKGINPATAIKNDVVKNATTPKTVVAAKKAPATETVAALPNPNDLASAILNKFNSADADPMAQLVQLIFLRESRELLKQQNEENARIARDAQRSKSRGHENAQLLVKQARCKHLKGATSTAHNPTIDYAVYQHTFSNAETQIKCRICGMRWRPEDTTEFLYRKGKKIRNHTSIGWREAIQMTRQSTDRQSMSEVSFGALYKAREEGRLATNLDQFGQKTPTDIVDENGELVADVEI